MYYYTVYDPDYGQAAYDNQRLNCGRCPKWADFDVFIDWAVDKMLNDQWPPDAVIGQKSQDDAVLLTLIERMTFLRTSSNRLDQRPRLRPIPWPRKPNQDQSTEIALHEKTIHPIID